MIELLIIIGLGCGYIAGLWLSEMRRNYEDKKAAKKSTEWQSYFNQAAKIPNTLAWFLENGVSQPCSRPQISFKITTTPTQDNP